jgi:hypothetical protein
MERPMKTRPVRSLLAMALVASQFAAASPVLASGATRAEIVVDGETDDWNGITPAITGEAGDVAPSGTPGDIASVFVTDNGLNLYFRIDTNQLNANTPVNIDIDADRNMATGYNANTDTLDKFVSSHNAGVDFTLGIAGEPGNITCALYDWRVAPPTVIQTGLAFIVTRRERSSRSHCL